MMYTGRLVLSSLGGSMTSRLFPLFQWFTASGWKQKFEAEGHFVDKDSLRVSGGIVQVFCRERKLTVPTKELHLVPIPWALLPPEHHTWVSLSEFTCRMVWYIGSADAVTAVKLHFEAVRRLLASAPMEAIQALPTG